MQTAWSQIHDKACLHFILWENHLPQLTTVKSANLEDNESVLLINNIDICLLGDYFLCQHAVNVPLHYLVKYKCK